MPVGEGRAIRIEARGGDVRKASAQSEKVFDPESFIVGASLDLLSDLSASEGSAVEYCICRFSCEFQGRF